MYFSINKDEKYWYEIHGEGVPLVLLHGFTGSGRTWESLIQSFLEKGDNLQLIVVDLPGHGQTITQTPRTMEACCEDLNKLFTFIGLREFHLLGYSMGGRTALAYALRYQEKILTLILESASPGLASKEERFSRIQRDEELAQRIEDNGVEDFVNFWENIPLFSTQKNLPAKIQQRIREERLNQTANGLAMSLRNMGTGKQPSFWEELRYFSKPVLLLVGEWDEKFIQINKKMQELFVDCNLLICEKSGHAIHVENSQAFDILVHEFIGNYINSYNEED
ncbi:2-succinyl-6-hydroxy-2,4-cyclohexadiene-1-carboxylate synthase [Oceanobacillus senegalensis]|uniref:2-succinyl-6-hydroxy-2, 4-cyclohexadiene-1-carboxylate synthase n=1 Tax=Oceanobacillus senegalensis TaxID=1936063 RepID=UPI000A30BA5E|nr:2-succinyl-6-hydroxy-2,4-cyclohexadiene-1-carboxylate synthase [Oceanobacillus senegalensis]